MKVEQLRQLIRGMVKEALREEAKPVIKEILGEMLLEQLTTNNGSTGNSHKGRALREASFINKEELEDYPTMGQRPVVDRSKMAEMLGYGDLLPGRGSRSGEITVTHAMTEAGTPVEIPPDAIPEHLRRALNKDYRPLLKKLDQNNNV